jgi:hypothetical protein
MIRYFFGKNVALAIKPRLFCVLLRMRHRHDDQIVPTTINERVCFFIQAKANRLWNGEDTINTLLDLEPTPLIARSMHPDLPE